jgi:DME family drug/metabolite transporter
LTVLARSDARAGEALIGLLLVGLAALSWGTTGSTLRLVGTTSAAVPLIVGAARMLVAAPLLASGARISGYRLRQGGRGFIVPGICMAAYQVCYFSAVPLAGVAATALLAICSAPILVALLARFWLGERLAAPQLVAMGMGVAGAVLLAGGEPTRGGASFVLGCGLALGAGLSYSTYVVATKSALEAASPLPLSALTFGLAAAVLLPVLALQPAATATTLLRGWPLLLYLGAIPTALAYWLYATGLRRAPAGLAALVGLVEPLTATVLGLLLFHERLGPPGAAGAALMLGAMALLARAASPPGGQVPSSRCPRERTEPTNLKEEKGSE